MDANEGCPSPKPKEIYEWILGVSGAQGRDRTTDTAIFSRMLYQLSYLGAARTMSGESAGL